MSVNAKTKKERTTFFLPRNPLREICRLLWSVSVKSGAGWPTSIISNLYILEWPDYTTGSPIHRRIS